MYRTDRKHKIYVLGWYFLIEKKNQINIKKHTEENA